MADDKGGSGGSKGWEPFEIVLVLILAIGFLSQLNGTKITVDKTPTKKTTTKTVVQPTVKNEMTCGLHINHPIRNIKVADSVQLDGYTEGCNWPSTETIALYAQVIDSQGVPVSDYVIVPVLSAHDNISEFNSALTITKTPHSGTGYVILVPAKSDGSQSHTARFPITF